MLSVFARVCGINATIACMSMYACACIQPWVYAFGVSTCSIPVHARDWRMHACVRVYMCTCPRSKHAYIKCMPDYMQALGVRVRAYMNALRACTCSVYTRTSYARAFGACMRARVHINAIGACVYVFGV